MIRWMAVTLTVILVLGAGVHVGRRCSFQQRSAVAAEQHLVLAWPGVDEHELLAAVRRPHAVLVFFPSARGVLSHRFPLALLAAIKCPHTIWTVALRRTPIACAYPAHWAVIVTIGIGIGRVR